MRFQRVSQAAFALVKRATLGERGSPRIERIDANRSSPILNVRRSTDPGALGGVITLCLRARSIGGYSLHPRVIRVPDVAGLTRQAVAGGIDG